MSRITANSDQYLKGLGIDIIAGGAVALSRALGMDAEGHVAEGRLCKQLMKAVLESQVKIKLGVKVTDVDVAKATITLESGPSSSQHLKMVYSNIDQTKEKINELNRSRIHQKDTPEALKLNFREYKENVQELRDSAAFKTPEMRVSAISEDLTRVEKEQGDKDALVSQETASEEAPKTF
ncbi:hypothetical protein MMC12_004225 [Toensbergia leucococca]|nr:hypothetical protein [Toensbergia leucococca]